LRIWLWLNHAHKVLVGEIVRALHLNRACQGTGRHSHEYYFSEYQTPIVNACEGNHGNALSDPRRRPRCHAYDWPNLDQLGSLVTTMFGAWTGMLVRSDVLPARKLKLLLLAMSISFAAGFATNQFSPCMYQLYTAPFIFHTTDFILLAVSVFFWLFDLKAYGKLAYPLVVLGMNSIFVYWVWEVLRRRAASRLAVSTHRDNYSASAVSGCVCSCDSGVGRLFCDVVSVLLAVQAEHFPKSLNPRGSAVGYRKLTDDHSMRSSRSLEEVEAPDTLQPFGSAPVGAHLLPPFV